MEEQEHFLSHLVHSSSWNSYHLILSIFSNFFKLGNQNHLGSLCVFII